VVSFLADEQRSEAFAAELGAGARYPVLEVIALLAASGAILTAEGAAGQGTAWWVLVALEAAILAAAAALFAIVPWRLWPHRLFATGANCPRSGRAFAGSRSP
jgi:hypothetical protein